MFKQLFRRYSDGTLVAKDDTYNSILPLQIEFTEPSNLWYMKHNNNTTKIICQVFIDNCLIPAANFEIVDANTIQIPFSTPQVGMTNLLFFK